MSTLCRYKCKPLLAVIFILVFTQLAYPQSHEWTTIKSTNSNAKSDSIHQVLEGLRYPVLGSDDFVEVVDYVGENRITLLWYFASWCWNCNQEVTTLTKMYNKYNNEGFEVIGIGLYSPRLELEKFRKKYNIRFPVVVGPSDIKDLETRQQTYHYFLRKLTGDSRTWGTPFHIFTVGDNLDSMFTAAGEIRESDFEEFLEKFTR